MSAHNHNFIPAKGQGKRRVALDGRVFFVGFKPDGSPLNIVERKSRADGRLSSSTYWHHSHGIPADGRGKRLKSGRSIVREVLETAGVDARHFNGH